MTLAREMEKAGLIDEIMNDTLEGMEEDVEDVPPPPPPFLLFVSVFPSLSLPYLDLSLHVGGR